MVPQLLCKGVYNGFPALVMDLQGPNLNKMLKMINKPFTFDCVAQIAVKVITALEAIHKEGVIHNALNPDKILISRMPQDTGVFLIDFKESKKVAIGASKNRLIFPKFVNRAVRLRAGE